MTFIIKCHKIETGTFNKFLNILGVCPKSKNRSSNAYELPTQRNRTDLLESLCRGTLKYASFRSILHM